VKIGDYIEVDEMKKGMLIEASATMDGFGSCLFLLLETPVFNEEYEEDEFRFKEYQADVQWFIHDDMISTKTRKEKICLPVPSPEDDFWTFLGDWESILE
jgi:hypothetical protein